MTAPCTACKPRRPTPEERIFASKAIAPHVLKEARAFVGEKMSRELAASFAALANGELRRLVADGDLPDLDWPELEPVVNIPARHMDLRWRLPLARAAWESSRPPPRVEDTLCWDGEEHQRAEPHSAGELIVVDCAKCGALYPESD